MWAIEHPRRNSLTLEQVICSVPERRRSDHRFGLSPPPYQGLGYFHYARMLHMDTDVMICARAIPVSVLVTYVNKGEN